MAGHKKEEPKKIYSYRAKPSIILKAKKKSIKEKTTLSQKIEALLYEYAN